MEKPSGKYFRKVLFSAISINISPRSVRASLRGTRNSSACPGNPNAIPIIATQSISSIIRTTRGIMADLLQTSAPRSSCRFPMTSPCELPAALRARVQIKASYNLSESGHDANVSFLTGKALSHKGI